MADKEVKLFIDEELWQRVRIAAARAGPNVLMKDVYTSGIRKEVEAIEKELDAKKEAP